jgi:hypothetical protein
MNKTKIRRQVEAWFREDELPPRANIKVVRKFDELYPSDPEECDAYWDFITWAMNREHQLLMSLPVPKGDKPFILYEPVEKNPDVR